MSSFDYNMTWISNESILEEIKKTRLTSHRFGKQGFKFL